MSDGQARRTTHEEPETPTKIEEGTTNDYVQEPCPKCGVVQKMNVVYTEYQDPDGSIRKSHHTDKDCAVCGHDIRMPW